MEDINDSNKQNLVSLDNKNGQSNTIWYFFSIISWFLLLGLQFDQFLNELFPFDEKYKPLKGSGISLILDYFFILKLFSLLRIFIFGITLFGFIIYLIFTTCKKDENLLNSMMSKWTKFHFISFLFISGLYIFLKLEIFVGKREEEPSKLFFSLIFIFSFLGCVSLIFFTLKLIYHVNGILSYLLKKVVFLA